MPTCRHGGHFGFSRRRFCDYKFSQFADTINNLPGIKPTLASEAVPVSSLEMIAPAVAGDLLSEVLRNILPNLTAHDVIYRCERCPRCVDHDRIVLGMSVGIAGDDIEHDHVKQTDNIGRIHVPPRYLKQVLQRRPANSCLIDLVLGRWRFPERLAKVFLVQATPTAADIDSIKSFHE